MKIWVDSTLKSPSQFGIRCINIKEAKKKIVEFEESKQHVPEDSKQYWEIDEISVRKAAKKSLNNWLTETKRNIKISVHDNTKEEESEAEKKFRGHRFYIRSSLIYSYADLMVDCFFTAEVCEKRYNLRNSYKIELKILDPELEGTIKTFYLTEFEKNLEEGFDLFDITDKVAYIRNDTYREDVGGGFYIQHDGEYVVIEDK